MPVLDTPFLIDLQAGVPEAVQARDRLRQSDLVVPAHAAMEFLAGVEDPRRGLRLIARSFRLMVGEEEHILVGARMRLEAARRGVHPGWGDVHIAATAVVESTFVVTADPSDFRALGVPAWDYRTEEAPPGSSD